MVQFEHEKNIIRFFVLIFAFFCQRTHTHIYLCPLLALENNDYDVKFRFFFLSSFTSSNAFFPTHFVLTLEIRALDIINTTAFSIVNTCTHTFSLGISKTLDRSAKKKANEYQVEQSQASVLNSAKY